MKTFFRILGVILILMGAGCSFVGCVAFQAVDEVATEMVEESNKQEEVVQEMFKNVEWVKTEDVFSTTLSCTVTNTSDVEIDYLEIQYKLLDANGVVVEKSFTNETDIAPGEARLIEIMVLEDYTDFQYEVKATVFE